MLVLAYLFRLEPYPFKQFQSIKIQGDTITFVPPLESARIPVLVRLEEMEMPPNGVTGQGALKLVIHAQLLSRFFQGPLRSLIGSDSIQERAPTKLIGATGYEAKFGEFLKGKTVFYDDHGEFLPIGVSK